jgi:hypothetical protein
MTITRPELTDELSSLSDEAAEAVVDLSFPRTPAHISAPQTPRWLSLTSYESMPLRWEWELELEAEIEDALVFSDDESEEHGVGESSDSCGSEFVEINAVEKASSKMLAVLRCYLYNLEQGMLITGTKVDERFEVALKRVLSRGEGTGRCNTQELKDFNMKEGWNTSDEEKVVIEIGSYSKELRKLNERIPRDI